MRLKTIPMQGMTIDSTMKLRISDLCGVVLQERLPALPGCPLRSPGHVPLYGGFRDVKTEFQQLAMYAWSSPELVVVFHLLDQVDLGLRDLWSAGF